MFTSRLAFCLLLSFQTLVAFTVPLNASNSLPSDFNEEPPSSHFLKDVLKAISVKQSWNLEEIRVSRVGVRNVRVGRSQRYEFRIRMGKSDLVFKFSDDEVDSWKKLRKNGKFGPLVNEASSKTVLNAFKLEGPFELQVDGDDDLSLVLPLNTTHTGLKRLLVGEGVTIEVEGAREVSLFLATDFGLPVNRSLDINKESDFWFSRHSLCLPLPPVQILGSASLVAYRTHNPNAYIEAKFLSRDTIELLPEKCYIRHLYKKRACPLDSLNPRVALLEKIMRSFLGGRTSQNGVSGFKAKLTASTLVWFQMELERDVGDNDTFWGTLADWRTKPTSERAWFEVLARVEANRLKPLMVKRVRPFIAADSAAWSNLMSNISFTKFPSVLVPPEALTLDVKW